MRSRSSCFSVATAFIVLSVLSLILGNPKSAAVAHRQHGSLYRRQSPYQYIADEQDPIKAAADIQQMQFIPNNSSVPNPDWLILKDDGGSSNPPWLSQVPFVQTPNAQNMQVGDGLMAWKEVPDLEGFTLNRTFQVLPNLVMPMYISQSYKPGQDNSRIQRAIVTLPGKPRDSWKYANLFRNALTVATSNPANGISADQVMIVGPVFLNSDDKEAGAVKDGELYWHGSQWQSGHKVRNEQPKVNLSSYHVLDNITDWIFKSGEFPSIKQVVLGGHSMGGQAVQRYALLKKTKAYDNNMHFWVGNPGSWAWPDDQRPYQNETCDGWSSWGYGFSNVSSVIGYARRDVNASREAIVERFRSRKVHYAAGLADTGPGDTHCQAKTQGGSHLDRASQFVLALGRLGGFPSTQTFDVIAGTSHQDYPMIRADKSVQRIFLSDFNTSFPLLVNTTNPGDLLARPHGNSTHPHHDPTQPKLKMYSTPRHRIIATALLGGTVVFIIIFFSMLPFVFSDNYDERAYQIEMSSRRRLLS
ncbi:hypothetical protein EX895_003983 [Sporisorium graminicola]|uniref:AB hydrolase-1 domain-containing protein n=1 Tax=Sporisorium graminicola TaxID=280036 RepID=A0A4U7KT89_9BASI|nr:hypothetical protein EX895_003983 [Sporisorium graminicola]TKY87306.1 hypothetical protein EX895_003983 [Sporisorium graminicola]